MDFQLLVLSPENYDEFRAGVMTIDRDDIPTTYVDTAEYIMDVSDYGAEQGYVGHTFAVKAEGRYVGMLILGEALQWETDPPEMRVQPFYRLMGFVIDKSCRDMGIGGKVLEQAIEAVYRDFGVRPIALGCHRDNEAAAKFYLRHGFQKTDYMEGSDIYYLRYPKE